MAGPATVTSGMDVALAELRNGSLYRFADWPNPAVPNGRIGVYTVWRDDQLVCVGMGGRAIGPDADISGPASGAGASKPLGHACIRAPVGRSVLRLRFRPLGPARPQPPADRRRRPRSALSAPWPSLTLPLPLRPGQPRSAGATSEDHGAAINRGSSRAAVGFDTGTFALANIGRTAAGQRPAADAPDLAVVFPDPFDAIHRPQCSGHLLTEFAF